MILFFRKFFYFILVFLFIIFINYELEKSIYKSANTVLHRNVTTVICGNSRLQMINPAWLNNTVNICKGGENFYFTYRTLSILIKENPNLKHVVLGTSFDSFLFTHTHLFVKNKEYYTPIQLLPYIRILSFEDLYQKHYCSADYLEIWLKKIYVPIDFENTLKIIFKYKFGYQGIQNLSYYGSFHISINSNLSKQSVLSFVNNINSSQISTWNEKWFYSIIKMCKSKNINLILVTTPFPRNVRSKIKSVFYSNFDRIIMNSKKINSSLTHLNYFKAYYPLNNFGDPHHLNSIGSKILADKIVKMSLDK